MSTIRTEKYPHNPGRYVFSESEWERIRRRLELSDREYDIARLVVEGRQRKSIAISMGRSVHTVHSHVRRLFRKAEVDSSLQLVARIVHEFRRARLADEYYDTGTAVRSGSDADRA